MGIIMLARATGVQMAERPHEQLVGAPPDYHQKTLIAQLADAVFHDFPIGLFLIAGVTALILVLAANTASTASRCWDPFWPKTVTCRASCTPAATGWRSPTASCSWRSRRWRSSSRSAEVTALIQLYIVGVFVSFTLSQIGMVRHWTRLLRTETDPACGER